MPKKASAKKPTKADFVRSLPPNLSAKEVVAKASAAKIKLDEWYVYRVRGLQRKAAGKGAAPSQRGRRRKGNVGQHIEHVRALRGVILHVGIDRAKEMMDQIVKDLMV